VFVVKVEVSRLDIDFGDVDSSINTPAKLYGRLTAYVNGAVCDTVDLLNERSSGFVVLEIGLPKQPEACRKEGATVTFAFGRNGEFLLQATLTLKRGSAVTLPFLAVQPPHTGGAGLRPDQTAENIIASPSNQPAQFTWRLVILATAVVAGTLALVAAARRRSAS
jgi:hypothetical protein